MLSTCSLTSGRVSKARTMAPIAEAAPMAASPATPAPMTSTLAGGTFPAAVIWPVKKRPKWFAASTTARYPATLAIELRVSNFWAREIRGTASIASVVTPRCASAWSKAGFCPGPIRETSVLPEPNSESSSSPPSASVRGARTLMMTSQS